MKNTILLVLGICLSILACQKDEPVPPTPPSPADPFDVVTKYLAIGKAAPEYGFQVPAGFELLDSDFQLDNDKVQLGRVLFYDKNLSKDRTVSCGTCHRQELAFADAAPVSRGVFNRTGSRNAMALGSFASFSGFLGVKADGTTHIPIFWDSRTFDLHEQVRDAFTNVDEMDMTMSEVESTVQAQPYYPLLFQAAFGDSTATESTIVEAVLHFMASLHSFESTFNAALDKSGDIEADFADFSAAENLGKSIYLEHCNMCHGSLNSPQLIFEANNGLDSVYADPGKEGHSGLFYDRGTFKVPALRNIALTAPYMHDGRFATLDEVIEHYSTGVVRIFGLHGDLLTQNPDGSYRAKHLNLSPSEKAALKAFMMTLTDEEMVEDVRYSDPFR